MKTRCGTPEFVAPDLLMDSKTPYGLAVDIWAIGIITYILLCGYPPFSGNSETELFQNIIKAEYYYYEEEWKDISDEAKDFIKKILVVDPQKRATAQDCLKHPVNQLLKKSLLALLFLLLFLFMLLFSFLFLLIQFIKPVVVSSSNKEADNEADDTEFQHATIQRISQTKKRL